MPIVQLGSQHALLMLPLMGVQTKLAIIMEAVLQLLTTLIAQLGYQLALTIPQVVVKIELAITSILVPSLQLHAMLGCPTVQETMHKQLV